MTKEDNDPHEKYFIVLVDDESRIHDFILSVFREADMVSRHATFEDPMSFVAFLQETEEEPDLVLLDVHFENAGLSGLDILPYVREEHPYLPVILLTGMDTDAMHEAQEDACTYFIPKPVSPENLIRMVRFYLGKGRKSARLISHLSEELTEYQEYQKLLEEEIDQMQHSRKEQGAKAGRKALARESFAKVRDILTSLLGQSEIMPSFIKDLEDLFANHFGLFKKAMEILVRFDVEDSSTTGMNIHKVKGTDHVYSARLSRKMRIYYYSSPKVDKKRLLRLDTGHDTKGMDKWLKNNLSSYAELG